MDCGGGYGYVRVRRNSAANIHHQLTQVTNNHHVTVDFCSQIEGKMKSCLMTRLSFHSAWQKKWMGILDGNSVWHCEWRFIKRRGGGIGGRRRNGEKMIGDKPLVNMLSFSLEILVQITAQLFSVMWNVWIVKSEFTLMIKWRIDRSGYQGNRGHGGRGWKYFPRVAWAKKDDTFLFTDRLTTLIHPVSKQYTFLRDQVLSKVT